MRDTVALLVLWIFACIWAILVFLCMLSYRDWRFLALLIPLVIVCWILMVFFIWNSDMKYKPLSEKWGEFWEYMGRD